MGIIKDRVDKLFVEFKEVLENQVELDEAMETLIMGLVEIADSSVHSSVNRLILDESIKENFRKLRRYE